MSCERCGKEYCGCHDCEAAKRGQRLCWNCLYNALHPEREQAQSREDRDV